MARNATALKATAAIVTLNETIAAPVETVAPIADQAFDKAAFATEVADFAKAKANRKATAKDAIVSESRNELSLILPAIRYAAATFDLQPLASYMLQAKPDAVVKRAIEAVFPAHRFALVTEQTGKKARGQYVLREGVAKVADATLLALLENAAAMGLGFKDKTVAERFPAPAKTETEKEEAQLKALANLIKTVGDKASVAALLKAL